MKQKSRRKSLRRELLCLCVIAFVISLVFYKAAIVFGVGYLSERYNTEEHIAKLEKTYAVELQNYVRKHKISIHDLEQIDKWTLRKYDVYLKLFYEGKLIYDTLYGMTEYEEVPEEYVGGYGRLHTYPIQFSDGKAEAVLFGYDYRLEDYARYVLLLVAFVLFLTILICGIQKKIRYLARVSREVENLSEDLEQTVTIQGEDEITTVAEGIEHLRQSVIEKMENEKAAYDANMNLITSLSHDLKTPLTSVIGYMELVREKAKGDEELTKCVDISLEKAMHLKKQTNDLFEHFLVHSNGYPIAFEEVYANELIVQMLEENLFDLEAKGVKVRRSISDITSRLQVNVHLIQSIFENLFSNLNKYADLRQEIRVRYYLDGNQLFVSLENAKRTEQNVNHASTKIGLSNCKAIMEKHHGSLMVEETEENFRVTLCFPVFP